MVVCKRISIGLYLPCAIKASPTYRRLQGDYILTYNRPLFGYPVLKKQSVTLTQNCRNTVSLIRKTRTLNLSYDVQIDLFQKTIKPILLYGCEIWGFGNNAIVERVYLKFLKIIFRLKRSTPSFMIYGELRLTPITVDVQARIGSYWSKLLENDRFKLTSAMYIEFFECIKMEFTNQSTCI